MSSDSSDSGSDTKVYKLRSRRYFPIWKQKMLSSASSKGFDKYLLNDVQVKTEAEIDTKETEYINEADDNVRRVKKGELVQMKRERKKSLAAAAALTSSVRSKDLKTLAKCKLDPKKMFDTICKKYGSEEDTDLSDLLDDFNDCTLKSKKCDPEDWYAELEQINEQLSEIDTAFMKSDKEVTAHILNNLPKGYKAIKTIIQMNDNYLDDLGKVKKQITKHWKANFRKKSRKSKYDSSSDDSSSNSESSEEIKKKRSKNKKKDQYALNIQVQEDRRNQYGIIICGHCGKPGHGRENCWELNGRPANMSRNNYNRQGDQQRPKKRCWNCGSMDHLAFNCPKNSNRNNDNVNNINDGSDSNREDEHLNSLFVGTMTHGQSKKGSWDASWDGSWYTPSDSDNESWCNVSKSTNTRETGSTRNMAAEKELKEILGMAHSKEEKKHEFVGVVSLEEEVHAVNNEDSRWETWLADTGASCHVTSNKELMTNVDDTNKDNIIMGDQRKCKVAQKGSLTFMTTDIKQYLTLNDIRVVKEIGKNIISIGLLLKQGGRLEGDETHMRVTINDVQLTFTKNEKDGLYYIQLKRLYEDSGGYCYATSTDKDDKGWKIVEPKGSKKWPKMPRDEAHAKWGHPHYDQMNKMAIYNKIQLTGKLTKCAGCGVIKSRAAKTTKTCSKIATKNGERLFIDTTGPYPKSRGGMKYWMCAVDDRSDKTWTYFATSKNKMVTFVTELVTEINGLDLQVKYIRCDNAGEHQEALRKLCKEKGITLEYTAPNTPQQNGRVEKKIHTLWQRAMTMMVNSNLTVESQGKFWAEAVACSNYLEDLVIKAGRAEPALSIWTGNNIAKWIKRLVEFGRIGVVNKQEKLKGKMKEKGFPAMMVGYAMNHGPGTYRLFNPKTNRIIFSRDVAWMDYKAKVLTDEFEVFEPGIESVLSKQNVPIREKEPADDLSEDDNPQHKGNYEDNEYDTSESDESTDTTMSTIQKYRSNKVGRTAIDLISTSDSSTMINPTTHNNELSDDSSIESKPSSSNSSSSTSSESNSPRNSNQSSRYSKLSKISRPIARKKPTSSKTKFRVTSSRKSGVPIPTVDVPKHKPSRHSMQLRSNKSIASRTRSRAKVKKVTGDTVPCRVRIFTEQDEGEDANNVNLVSEYEDNEEQPYFFALNETTIDRIYKAMPPEEGTLLQVYTMELYSDPETPNTIKQALTGEDKELWKKSATAEVNNFLKRKSWKFIPKSKVLEMGRKLIGVKWVFKIKNEPDYSLRYKSRVVSKGYMQIPGVDYSEKFSPVAQASSVRAILAMTLWYHWDCELVDIEAAFLEGRLKTKAYIELPPGLVELGFMTKEEYKKSCIELQGGMYGNVDAALLYFIRFTEYAINPQGLDLIQSKADPCLFFKKNNDGKTVGVIVVYVDDCVLAGEKDFINEMKSKLKDEFGVVEDGQLRKLLGVRYKWDDLNDPVNARVTLSMQDKAEEIIRGYEKATGLTPRTQKTPGKPGEILEKHEGEAVKHSEYRSILGKLMFYVTKISPECSFACGQLARQMHSPGEKHWEAMGRIIGYLKGKDKHELVIRRPMTLKIISFGDASYGDCKDTRRSSTGDIHTIGGSLVSWRAQKTRVVCLSGG